MIIAIFNKPGYVVITMITDVMYNRASLNSSRVVIYNPSIHATLTKHLDNVWCLLECLSTFNPLSPYDALKHHLTSLKKDLISLQPRVLERKFPRNWFTNTL